MGQGKSGAKEPTEARGAATRSPGGYVPHTGVRCGGCSRTLTLLILRTGERVHLRSFASAPKCRSFASHDWIIAFQNPHNRVQTRSLKPNLMLSGAPSKGVVTPVRSRTMEWTSLFLRGPGQRSVPRSRGTRCVACCASLRVRPVEIRPQVQRDHSYAQHERPAKGARPGQQDDR